MDPFILGFILFLVSLILMLSGLIIMIANAARRKPVKRGLYFVVGGALVLLASFTLCTSSNFLR
jgi:heme/copper-type cytochrome/quinol oxidase subunit 3